MKDDPGCEVSDDLRRLLRTRLMGARCLAEDMADLLAIHRRTLAATSRMAARGTNR